MVPISPIVRTILTFVATAVAFLAGLDPFGFSSEVQAILAAVAAGFAAIGIIPPQMIETDHGHTQVFARRRDVP